MTFVSPFSRPFAFNVPDVLDSLVAMLQQSAAGLDFLIKDGPWTSAESEPNAVCIGWSGFHPGYEYPTRSMSEQQVSQAVTVTTEVEGMGPSIKERMSIACSSLARPGGGDNIATRRTAYNQVKQVGLLLRAPWPAGVMIAWISGGNLLYQLERRGPMAVVTFTIEAEAYAQQ